MGGNNNYSQNSNASLRYPGYSSRNFGTPSSICMCCGNSIASMNSTDFMFGAPSSSGGALTQRCNSGNYNCGGGLNSEGI